MIVNRNGVKRRWKGKVRALTPNPDGYMHAEVNGQTVYVHRLVMQTFVGPRPEGLVILHRDDDTTNNSLSNLRYGTQGENVRQAVDAGTHRNVRKTTCPKGHPYDAMNGKHRRCRQCHAANERSRRVHLALR